MCGIIGYIGSKQVVPILVNGLRRLEYRGYDSSGIAVFNKDGGIDRVRAVGKVDNLSQKLDKKKLESTVGIAHTRWATHGGVTLENAHPHVAHDGKLAIVHNGIIENYRELKEMLGVDCKSETDTEILAHLISSKYTGDLRSAVTQALKLVQGTYGLVVMHQDHLDNLVVARLGSPLVIGIGNAEQGGTHEYFVASDATPLLSYTKDVVYLDDGELATVSTHGIQIYNLNSQKNINTEVIKKVETIEWSDEEAQKQGFDHFMLKEIHDQPKVFQDAIRGRINNSEGTSILGGLNMTDQEIQSIDRIILIACGTASYAAMIGKYAIERLARIPVEVEIASEFRYKDPVVNKKTLVFAISQSGETADTLAALKEAKRRGAYVRGIVNVIGSTIARETDGGTYIHAGPELSVASTKAYTNMVAVLLLYAIQFGRARGLSIATGQRLISALQEIPSKMEEILKQKDKIKIIAEKYKNNKDCYFLGRGINYPVALEGSLKLKEISYIHSEGYAGGELKHGPIALLQDGFPVIVLATKNQLYKKMCSNIEEIKARGADIFAIATKGDKDIKDLCDDVIFVPETMELLEPLLNTIPLQLFSYYVAIGLDRDVDRPRNLAKSVTVE